MKKCIYGSRKFQKVSVSHSENWNSFWCACLPAWCAVNIQSVELKVVHATNGSPEAKQNSLTNWFTGERSKRIANCFMIYCGESDLSNEQQQQRKQQMQNNNLSNAKSYVAGAFTSRREFVIGVSHIQSFAGLLFKSSHSFTRAEILSTSIAANSEIVIVFLCHYHKWNARRHQWDRVNAKLITPP